MTEYMKTVAGRCEVGALLYRLGQLDSEQLRQFIAGESVTGRLSPWKVYVRRWLIWFMERYPSTAHRVTWVLARLRAAR